MIDFNKTEGESTNGGKLQFIQPGVHDVTITSLTYNDEKSFNMGFTDEQGLTADNRFWMDTDKKDDKGKTALDKSLEMILHIATKCMEESVFKSKAVGGTIQELVVNLNNLLLGKRVRIKFMGKEIQGTDGKKTWFKAQLPRFRFAESIDTPKEHSRLFFDKNNQYDMKYLANSTSNQAVASSTTNNDDLPF